MVELTGIADTPSFFEDPCDDLLLGMISSFTHAHTHSSLLDGRIFLCFSLDSPTELLRERLVTTSS